MGECSGQVGSGAVAAPTNRKSNTVVVDTGRYRYSLQELTGGPDWHQFIVLTGHDHSAHEQMKFYRDSQSFVGFGQSGGEAQVLPAPRDRLVVGKKELRRR